MRRAERLAPHEVPGPDERDLVACPDCGLWQRRPPVPAGFHAECRRCRRVLARCEARSLHVSLALVVAALLMWLPACFEPLMRVTAEGAERQSALTSGVSALWAGGFPSLAVVVAAFSIVVPWIYLLLLACVLAGVSLRRPPSGAGRENASPLAILYRWAVALRPWAMIEVYLLGACVAYSRLEKIALVGIGPAGWCLIAAAMLLFVADVSLDDSAVWHAIPFRRASPPATGRGAGPFPTCVVCDLTAPQARTGERCPRCHARLFVRKSASLERTWALVLTGCLLFIPANLLPVLSIERFGREQPSTILGGVIELVHYGLWPLAAIVFTASIAIPLAKLGGLSWNLFMTQRGSTRLLVGRTRLHRVIERVGRWSNIDVFMVSILVALVQFGELTRVRVENGMIAFAAVVIVTMMASKCFDSRLMWDKAGGRR
jgi:paraquat-inducible protein A